MTTIYEAPAIDLRAYYTQDRRYTLEELERLLPPLPTSKDDDEEGRERHYEGAFNPHHGEPLPDDARERFLDYVKGLGLTRNADRRYRGPCPFPHENGPSDGESAFYVSPISGAWHCFGSSHEGSRNGGITSFGALDFRVHLPQYRPNPEATRELFAVKRGRPPEEKRGREPTLDSCHHYQGCVDECWPIHRQRRKAALKQGKTDRLTGEIRRHWDYLAANTRTADAEKYPIVFLKPNGVKLCISVEHHHLATPDLEPLAVALLGERDAQGEINPTVKRLRECGRECKWVCPGGHGEKLRGLAQCGLHFDPHCLTDTAKTLDQARLPDIDPESGAAYRSVWLLGRYPLPADLPKWEEALKSLQKTWEDALVKLQRRKATKGSILWRSFTVYYTEDEGLIHWKVMLREDCPGAADGAVTDLCQVMDAEVYDDRRFVHGELASLQLVENARSHLLGFSKEMAWETKLALFAAHYAATRGRHIFQGMGVLWSLLREVPKPEPLTCDECGLRLKQVLINDEPSREEMTVGNPLYGRSPPGRGYGVGVAA